MNKLLLCGACAMMGASAMAQAELRDITPAGYDFDKYEVGQNFKLTLPGEQAATWQLKSNSWDALGGAAAMEKDGQFTVEFLQNQPADNTEEYLTALNKGCTIQDFGGNLGKCLVFTQQWSPFTGNTDQYEHYGVLPADGKNPTNRFYYLYLNPETTPAAWTPNIRCRVVLNIARRARHQFASNNPVFSMYAMSDAQQNIYPKGDNDIAAANTLDGHNFAWWEGETRNVAHITEDMAYAQNDDSSRNEYFWNPDRFIVYEFDTFTGGAEDGAIRFLMHMRGTNSTIIIKEIKFFEITNPEEIAGSPYDYAGKRNISYRYYWSNLRSSEEPVAPEHATLTVNDEPAELDGLTLKTADGDLTLRFAAAEGHEVYHALEAAAPAAKADGLEFVKHDTENGLVIEKGTEGTLHVYTSAPYFGLNTEVKTIALKNTSGIEAVEAEANAPVEYFNLQGIRVENPANGLYIMRQGSKISKVAL